MIGLMSCATMTAAAHQPFESSAQVRLENEGVELTLTASLEIAKLLAEQSAETGDAHKRFLDACSGLYEVISNGGPVRPERVFYNEREGEAVFSAIYPAARPGELRLRAVYLDRLPIGYGGSIRVMGEGGGILAFQQRLRKGDANNSVSVRLKEAVPVPAVVPASSHHAPISGHRSLMAIGFLTAPVLVGMAALFVRNKPKEKTHV